MRRALRTAIAVLIPLATAGMAAMTSTATASAATSAGQPVVNPYSPAYQHPYRHGVVPTLPTASKMAQWAHAHPQAAAATELNYNGGFDGGIGVTTGHEQVYLVFYGSQWGTQSTDANGDVTLSGDPSGEAPDLQEFFKGLGTNNELWSGVMTQYCDGVAVGAQSCPASNTEHVAYPTGGALAGVWVDESAPSPQAATQAQLAAEATSAATHFGNTTAAANRDAQYVVLSPTGTNPDNWLTSGYCAWHSDTDSAGDYIAYTNMPYITDQGAYCGKDFLNSNGTLDGVTIIGGHEYAETVTDQLPFGGWADSSDAETGDKCAWITPGTSGGVFNLSLATGTFAVQTTWANDGNGGAGACEGSHPIVTDPSGGNTVTVTSPGNQSGTTGTAVSLQISATDSAPGQTLTYSATGLPAGLSISSSGLISGTPTTAATSTVTVTATDTTGATGSANFTWTISSPSSGGLVNGDFETGSLSPWVCQPGDAVVTSPVHSGNYALQVTPTSSQTGECDQTITLSPNTSYTLNGWVQGNYAYIGVSGGATASNWTSSSSWTPLSVPFTTGSSGTVTVYVHGWYAQGNVYADDFSIS
jgi:hypothetical protein